MKVKTRKATGLKSVLAKCWEINHVTSKCQIDVLDKTCKRRSKTEKVNITVESYLIAIRFCVYILNFMKVLKVEAHTHIRYFNVSVLVVP